MFQTEFLLAAGLSTASAVGTPVALALAEAVPLEGTDQREATAIPAGPSQASPHLAVTRRSLRDDVVAVTDDLGGWRLEHSAHAGLLLSVEDPLGTVVEITRDGSGRPIGLLMARRLAVEYGYDDDGLQWRSKRAYDVMNGEVLAELERDESAAGSTASENPLRSCPGNDLQVVFTCVDGRRYSAVAAGSTDVIVRSVVIDGAENWWLGDRIDYTGSQLVVYLDNGTGKPEVAVAISRSREAPALPNIAGLDEPYAARYGAVWSTTRVTSRPEPGVPKLAGSLPSAVEEVLHVAFPIALDRVRWFPTCRSLFEALAVSGNARLQSSLYAPPSTRRANDSCSRGAIAYTHVGSPVTHLCAPFGKLSADAAALVLIHEALHYAGMMEAPAFEGALTSTEIHELVRAACDF